MCSKVISIVTLFRQRMVRMSMKMTKEEFMGGLDYDYLCTEECLLKDIMEVRQYLQDKFPGLAEKVFKTEYLGEWKDDDGRD